jgi:hypothetical protein
MAKGIKTKSDYSTFEKLTSSIQKAQSEVSELYSEISSKHLKMNVDFDTAEIKQARTDIKNIQ